MQKNRRREGEHLATSALRNELEILSVVIVKDNKC